MTFAGYRSISEEIEDLICDLYADDVMIILNIERFFKQLSGVLKIQFETNYLDDRPEVVENMTLEFFKFLKYTELGLGQLDTEKRSALISFLGEKYCSKKLFSLSQCFPELIQDV